MNKIHAPSKISLVTLCGLVMVPLSDNLAEVTCKRCLKMLAKDTEKLAKPKDKA